MFEPDVDRHILQAAGERLIAEEGKHWVVLVWPVVRVALGIAISLSGFVFDSRWLFWLIFIGGLIIMMNGIWHVLAEYRDRFVITNQRVMRLTGVVNTNRASVPLLRILDITVSKPLWGRWLNFGHFTFESAAQVQGLNKITYIKDIDKLEDALRMVMQPDQVMIDPNEEEGI
jgi:hypothetical protein